MSFNEWIHHHTRSVLFVMIVLALAGALAIFFLPVSLFPRVSFPRVEVNVDSGDQPPQTVAVQITYPVEEAIRSIPGVQRVSSSTGRGAADIFVDFAWGTNMVQALLQVQSEVNNILPSLPAGTVAAARLRDASNYQSVSYSLTSDSVSPVDLRQIAQYQIRPLLLAIDGVAGVDVLGGQTREYQVIINPAMLAVHDLTIDDITQAVTANNILESVGNLEDHDKLYLVVSDSRFNNVGEIGGIPVKTSAAGVVYLRDVAQVVSAIAPNWTSVTADGKDAVLIDVYQQSGGNTVKLVGQTQVVLDGIKNKLPAGVIIKQWYSQGDLLLESADSVRDAVVVGLVMAVVVLLLFLRNVKITLIAALVVPAVLASTVLLLYLLKMSFNIMTLGGMAAAVGLIIDDAIVMIEHIIRRVGEKGGTYRQKIIAASAEFTRPLAGSSASTIIIFAPLAFWSGLIGEFFKALSLTMAAGLLISFLLAWLAVPVLAVRLIGEKDAVPHEPGWLTKKFHAAYEWILNWFIPRPNLVLLIVVPVLAVGYLAYQNVGSGFMPSMDEGGFILDYTAPPGTSLTETVRMLRQVEQLLLANPNVETFSCRTGLQLGGGLTEPYTGDFFIKLKPFPRPPIDRVMDQVTDEIQDKVPGLQVLDTAQLMQDEIGDLTDVPQPIQIEIFSDDQTVLDRQADKVLGAIQNIPGVIEAQSGVVVAGDWVDIKVDPVAAALYGMTPDQITQLVNEYVSGTVATNIQRGALLIGVRVWSPADMRKTVDDLGNLMLRSSDGRKFSLGSVATFQIQTGQQEIDRDNLKRMIAVTARISGRDMGSTLADVQKVLDQPNLFPAGVYYQLGGLYHQQQIAFQGLLVVMIAAVLLVFLLLLFLYESFRVAIAMMVIPLLALACVFIGLWITGTELNVSSMMGMTMVVGIVTEVTIFYYSEYHELRGHEHGTRRLIQAGKNRMRPIAMTTIAAILALLPLALEISRGSAMQQPLAVAIISGLVVQMPLTLLVLPTLLGFIHEPQENSPEI